MVANFTYFLEVFFPVLRLLVICQCTLDSLRFDSFKRFDSATINRIMASGKQVKMSSAL